MLSNTYYYHLRGYSFNHWKKRNDYDGDTVDLFSVVLEHRTDKFLVLQRYSKEKGNHVAVFGKSLGPNHAARDKTILGSGFKMVNDEKEKHELEYLVKQTPGLKGPIEFLVY